MTRKREGSRYSSTTVRPPEFRKDVFESKDRIVGSLAHGVVANDSWKNEINTSLGIFLTDKNVDAFQASLVTACASSGPCK